MTKHPFSYDIGNKKFYNNIILHSVAYQNGQGKRDITY